MGMLLLLETFGDKPKYWTKTFDLVAPDEKLISRQPNQLLLGKVSVRTRNVNLIVAPEKKFTAQQSHQDSSLGDLVFVYQMPGFLVAVDHHKMFRK